MLRALGIAAGILSLTMLAWKGFHVSLGPLLEDLLKTYEYQASNSIQLIESLIKQLGLPTSQYSLNLDLYPHWQYSFVLMWLLFGTLARTAWWEGNRITAVFLLLWGGLVAFIAGAFSGTVALEGATSNMAMAFFPIAGVVVFYLGYDAWFAAFFRDDEGTWLATFERGAQWVLMRFALPGVLVLVVGTQSDRIPYIQTLANPGLALLAALVVANALYFLWSGALSSRNLGSNTRWQRFLADGDTHAAFDILSVIAGTAVIIIIGKQGM